mmetsp:Transcript_88007/g.284923  ORF Transcript_88007/g.284923 Transcript_88007/m.284923 type:complete len:161 (+) Transcript_88007:535-1017(+)
MSQTHSADASAPSSLDLRACLCTSDRICDAALQLKAFASGSSTPAGLHQLLAVAWVRRLVPEGRAVWFHRSCFLRETELQSGPQLGWQDALTAALAWMMDYTHDCFAAHFQAIHHAQLQTFQVASGWVVEVVWVFGGHHFLVHTCQRPVCCSRQDDCTVV